MVLPDRVKIYARKHQGSKESILWQGRGKLYRYLNFEGDIAPTQSGVKLLLPKSVANLEQYYIAEVNGIRYTILSLTPVSDSRGIHHYTATLKERKGR